MDSHYKQYSANILAESIGQLWDTNSLDKSFMDSIIDHKKRKDTMVKDHVHAKPTNKTRKPVVTLKGWFFQVKWKDGRISWIPLRFLKELVPLETAEYSKSITC